MLAVSGRQLVHLLHGGAVFPGSVRVPAAQGLRRLPPLQHAGVGDGVGAESQRVGTVDLGAFGLVSVLLLAGQLGAVGVGGLLLQTHGVHGKRGAFRRQVGQVPSVGVEVFIRLLGWKRETNGRKIQ